MTLWTPTRRELITTTPLALGAAALPLPLLAAQPDPLRFFVIGDWGRAGSAYQVNVARRMGQLAASWGGVKFVVTTGDNFYEMGVARATSPQWDRSFDNIYTHPALGVPWYATLGNHDYYGFAEEQIKRTKIDPRGRWQLPYYWHSWRGADANHGHPEIDLFFIDTVTWKGEDWKSAAFGSKPTPERHKEQIHWLDRQLGASTARFKLVFGHHGIYSIGKHGGTKEMTTLDELLRRHKVTAYINGHDHCMYHITHQGMHYICSGAGSQMLVGYTGDKHVGGCVIPSECDVAADGAPLHPVWHRFFGKSPIEDFRMDGGFASFEVWPTAISIQFHDSRPRDPKHEILITTRA